MLSNFASVLVFFVVGFIFLAITLILSRLLQSKGILGGDKYLPYECGEVPEGSAKLGTFAYVEGLIFIGILVVGLAYVWKKKDLEWVKTEDLDAMKP
ncbi:MAG: NADH-quinone oxidoreductase subunit A [Acidobacteriota bacterium]